MSDTDNNYQPLKQRLSAVAAIIFSGICWYLSNGLTGGFWFLLWIAPVPVLILSFTSTGRQKDDWLHSRMAVLRGVENGFSEIRAAREGRLTISDCQGRVTSESSASDGKESVLAGNVSLERRNTLYTRFGDWFGTTCMIAAICMVLVAVLKKFL